LKLKRLLAAVSSALLLLVLAVPAQASAGSAEELTEELSFVTAERDATARVTDGNIYSWQTIFGSAEIKTAQPVTQLYIIWRDLPGAYTISFGRSTLSCGENSFLHELVSFPEPVDSFSINCDDGWICELRAFTDGKLPDDVQIWELPDDSADILVFPTHADDDCLFFGAFIADAVNRGLDVQLAFPTVHSTGRHPGEFWDREHERLNAMWEMGLTSYPCSGGFPDYGSDYVSVVSQMFGTEKVVEWQVGLIRRFKPQIILCHDTVNGEYGNNAHKVHARCLTEALFAAADCTRYTDSFEDYGVWQARKLYIHLRDADVLDLDVNTPLEAFGGRTGFEVAQDAYDKHESQHTWYGFQVKQDDDMYNCRLFGLAYSAVGPDTGNDYTEHLTFEKD